LPRRLFHKRSGIAEILIFSKRVNYRNIFQNDYERHGFVLTGEKQPGGRYAGVYTPNGVLAFCRTGKRFFRDEIKSRKNLSISVYRKDVIRLLFFMGILILFPGIRLE